jgi:peptidoglycan/xylan/chitin deacetylase (PgdA/CDA1 family)
MKVNSSKPILLTFDLEEFDLPLEFKCEIEILEQLDITTQGLDSLLHILEKHQVVATFFTTAFYAETHPDLIKKLVQSGHEIASHMYYHSDYNTEHVLSSKLKLEQISGSEVNGFRSPRFKYIDKNIIKAAGYTYDSSINPTYLPGRYNNLNTPRSIYYSDAYKLHILPMSVSARLRIPLFWLAFKNFNFAYYSQLCFQALKQDSYLHLYFHPWEFTDITKFDIPFYIKRNSGVLMLTKLDRFIILSKKKECEFLTIRDYLVHLH